MADKSVINSTVKCNTTMFMNFLRYSMPASVSIDIYRQTSTESKLAYEVIYMTVASLQFTMSIFFNLLTLRTVLQKKIRITSCGIYLLFFTLASLIGMSIFYLRIIVTLYFNDELEKHNLIHCRLSSMILNCAQILCLWIGAFISVERVLIECFHFSIYRSRICAIISSLLILLLTIASCITWFLGTQYAIHPIIPTMYLCKMRQLQSTWILVDEIFTTQTFGFLFYIYSSNVYMNRYHEAWIMNCTKFRHRSAQCCATIKLMKISIDNVNNSSNITAE
ncbi:unnamed protein product [Adineta steineri]|uniref:G-protein coupled receptors family 1 profile domain-containing protein n=1 Tax=Adineta steineri TaxID=433720 RepID=A0A814WZ79_9BILA|nr:unnamed protein product [Adineta steineri]CAF1494369.1 unnamed protein product [Adineta steineri]